MELLGSILGSVVTETARAIFGSMCSGIISSIKFNSNIRTLNDSLSTLKELSDRVDRDLEAMEIRGRSLQVQLRRWLRDVEEIVSLANTLQEEEHVPCTQSFKCRLSKKLVKVLEQVKTLEKQGKQLVDMLLVDVSLVKVEYIPGPSILDHSAASQMLDKVMNCLMDNKVQKIGIWGMAGVGKTTLVKALNNKLREEANPQPFGLVIWATASKKFELKRVRRQIAERLDMEIKPEETGEKLVRRIHRRLERARSFLLILDDVWKPIDLDLLGIPRTERHRSSKILLTSKYLEVCRSMVTDVDIKVECLCEEEAWALFCQNAGEVARSDHVEPIAKQVSHECGGLPLAIITVGTAMRGKTDVRLWKHALNELKRSVPWIKSIEENIYQPLKLSYDLLESKLKSCFLFCAMFPEDYSIEESEIVKYLIAEGVIDEQHNHARSINEGVTLVENLKDSCLLEDGIRYGTVKMHDVVRDFAIWIMSSSQAQCRSLVISGTGLQEISPDEFVLSIQRVSLMNNKLERLPDSVVECVEASALLLQGNIHLREVPDGFLQAFPTLQILNLSGTRVSSLPRSLSRLHSLHSLILRDCRSLVDLPSLENLLKLRLLDLHATSVREFPRGLEALNCFRHLDLSQTPRLESIPAGIISRLTSLEDLDMTESHYNWGIEAQAEHGQATFEEIARLYHLRLLSIRLVSVPSLSSKSKACIQRLKRFQLFICPTAYFLPTGNDKRRVTISSLNVSRSSTGWLLEKATSLVLNHCRGLNEMLKNLVTQSTSSFNAMKSLTIESFSNSIKFEAESAAAQLDLLPNLEELHLRRVNLETIQELVDHLGLRFQTLKLLEVSYCPHLKCLLSTGAYVPSLPNLEEIRISFCERLQVLFNVSPELVSATTDPVVPKLRVIKLRDLPQLSCLFNTEETSGCLEQVDVAGCNLLKSLPISSENADRVKEIRGESQWWNSLNWNDDSTLTKLQSCFVPTT